MSDLKRPDIYDYPPGLDGAYQYQVELTEYYKAALSIAVSALENIGAFNDEGASMVLKRTGSYGFFDEPGSVEIARQALQSIKGEANEHSTRT